MVSRLTRSAANSARCRLALCLLVLASGCATPPQQQQGPLPTSAEAADHTIVAIAAPRGPGMTLPEFLGIKALCNGVRGLAGRLLSRLGSRFPGLEPRPPLKPITDPENLESDNPAVKSAAEAKSEEDQAAQKVKAIRYLGTLGCDGCYPGVEEALLAALDDCTESVRYEAARALYLKSGSPCCMCKSTACCSNATLKKLDQVANGRDEQGCYEEASARVRRMARLAMRGCGGPVYIAEDVPQEGPSSADLPAPEGAAQAPAAAGAQTTAAAEAAFEETSILVDRVLPPGGGVAVEPGPDPVVLARVNGEPVYDYQVARSIRDRTNSVNQEGKEELIGSRRELAIRALESVIEKKLIVQAARSRMSQGDSSLSLFFDEVTPVVSGEDPAAEVAPRVVQALVQEAVGDEAAISKVEVAQYYQQNAAAFHADAAVRYEVISIPYRPETQEASRALAEHLQSRALGKPSTVPDDADFSAARRRVVEWVSYNAVEPAGLRDALRATRVGGVAPVVETENAFLVARVLAKRPDGPKPLETVESEIRATLKTEKAHRAEAQYRQRLWREAEVWTVFGPLRSAE